eukprot:m.59089 g.59089  ORF g.59089 m.59089 type:complete len:596 (-) comp12939_c0_seq1:239-2026(-)
MDKRKEDTVAACAQGEGGVSSGQQKKRIAWDDAVMDDEWATATSIALRHHDKRTGEPTPQGDESGDEGGPGETNLDDSIDSDITEFELKVPPPSYDAHKSGCGCCGPLGMATGSLTTWTLVRLAMLWLGMSCVTDFLSFEAVPSQVRSTVGDSFKTSALTIVVLTAAFATLIASPLVGTLSDNCMFKAGRRRPFIATGAVVTVVFLMLLALSNTHLPPQFDDVNTNCSVAQGLPDDGSVGAQHTTTQSEVLGTEDGEETMPSASRTFPLHGSLPVYTILFTVLSLGHVLVEIPFNGMVSDVVPAHQRGAASSIMGVTSILGGIVGMGMGLFYRNVGVAGSFALVALFLIISVALCCSVKENKPLAVAAAVKSQGIGGVMGALKSYIKPFSSSDFCWLFFTRFLMMMGAATMGNFLEYWLNDVVVLPDGVDPERGVAILILCMIVPAIPSTLASGYASDKSGRRKVFVVAGGAMMALAASLFVRVTEFYSIVAMMVVAGIGTGMYLALDFALALDVTANSATPALDLAVWHQAEVLPRMLATPLAAGILSAVNKYEDCDPDDACQKCTLGWKILWSVVVVYFVLAAAFVYRIKASR